MKKLFIVASVTLVLTGCGAVRQLRQPDAAVNQETRQEVAAAEPVKNDPVVDTVSLMAMMQKEYDGRDLKLGTVLAVNESYTRYYITYRSSELLISGIMNVPKGTGPFPVLILNHGHIDQKIYTNGRGLKREQDYLARRGYVVLHSDYRNHADSDDDPDNETRFRFGYLEDVINAVIAVRNSNFTFVDKEHIGMLGHSMGGGVAIQSMVVKPGLVDAYVLFAPVSADYQDNFKKWIERRPELAQQIIDLYGTAEQNPDFWENISAVNFLDRVTEPIMIHHGTKDESVPLEWSQRLNEKLKAAGKDITLYIYDGEPHEFINAWPLVMRRTADFFDQHLKPAVDTN